MLWHQGVVSSLHSPTAGTRWVEGKLMSHREITALGSRHCSQRYDSPVKSLVTSSPSRLTPSHVSSARTLMGSSLGLPSASPRFQAFPFCYLHLISVIWRWGVLHSPSCTLFLPEVGLWRHQTGLSVFKTSSLWSITAFIAPGHFSPNACPPQWPALPQEHPHNMLEQCWSYWCNFATKCSLV